MSDLNNCFFIPRFNDQILDLFPQLIDVARNTAEKLTGSDRRTFMAEIIRLLGTGGQRKAEAVLKWNRGTIRKGEKELESGIPISDNFSGRGRKKTEEHLPNLLEDIQSIVEPSSQADPTFRTTQIYTPLTAAEVRSRLITDKDYSDEELPCIRTINTKLDELNFHPQKVAKTKPAKKIPETDAIFKQVHKVNKEADETEGVLRISMDAKAKINIGPFSRGGYSRQGVKGGDHDFAPETVLKLFGIFLPAYSEPFFFFTQSNVTADFMVDSLESLWSTLNERFNPHTLVINLDNGPDNSSSRTQFIKRIVDFAHNHGITIRLAYYPPYHSKYNPIERVWGVLENHWNGELLDSQEKVLGLAGTMKWNGNNPIVELIQGVYEKGIKLTKKGMKYYENMINRLKGLEKWSVTIPCLHA